MKQRSFFLAVASATGLLCALAASPLMPQSPAAAATPPPPPPALPTSSPQPTAVPGATPTPLPLNFGVPQAEQKSAKPKATPAPPKDQRIGISGVWEVQIQRGGTKVEYVHFKLEQDGSALTGHFRDLDGKTYPLAGSVDGKNVRVVVTKPDGTSIIFSGTVDGTTDMLGMMTDAHEEVVFTAAYRPKESWLDNVNPAPGLGSGGLGNPPR